MLVAISYHDGDISQMRRWASHARKLGGVKSHRILLLPAHGASTDGVLGPLKEAFSEAIVLNCHHTDRGWPISCNKAFEEAAYYAFAKQQPFLWMEPDAIPLKSSWVDDIESEYMACGKPFMGDFVGIAGIMPNGIDHMSGIAVYHWNTPGLSPSIFRNERNAWDIMSAGDVVHKMYKTNLIQHDWIPEKKWRRDKVDSSCVKPGAVIYHPDKLGVLFDDGLSPNGTQGDPAAGVPCEGSPHETKEKPSPGTQPAIDQAISNAINILIFHANISRKAKKEITERLCQEGMLPKAKGSKQSRKKIRSTLVKHKRPITRDGVSVSPNEEVESGLRPPRQPHSHRD
jgi:hypothetical protein